MPVVKQNREPGTPAESARPRAPRPVGPLSGKRSRLRRLVSRGGARFNELLDALPPGRWLHRFVQRGLEYTEVDVTLRRGGPGLNGLRIAFVSDVHAGSYMNERDLCVIFDRIAAEQPDLVCLGGDLINTRHREIHLLREPLSRIDPPLGVFAVPGNHDHFFGDDIDFWNSTLTECGVQVLTNRGARVERDGASLWIAGVDDLTEAEPDLDAALQGRHSDEPVLLLSHHPDFFVESVDAGVDLQLSGHTHGGQIVLFGWTPLKHSKFGYWRGHFHRESSQLYVGRGAGVTLLPIRFGARAEVPLLRLRVPG